ncbi:hypothetical protein ACSMEV_18195 [Pseudomonas sp. MLB6B]
MADFYGAAAVRHFSDAEILAASERWDGAGHLVGFSAECSIKHGVGALRPDADGVRKHLPELTEVAKRLLNQRRQSGIYTILKNPMFMSGWAVEARYSDDGVVDREQYMVWRQQAYALLHAVDLRVAK